jgi:two-component system, OmpR family, phosphate regulon sensor histidine kinase PhoR
MSYCGKKKRGTFVMMKQSKENFTFSVRFKSIIVPLILSSVILLLVLQIFWLRGAYNNESISLRKESQLLFRDLIFEMNDSLLQKSINSLPERTNSAVIKMSDSVKIVRRFGNSMKIHGHDTTANVQVFVYTESSKDSIKDLLKPLVNKIRGRDRPQTFSIQLNNDSLKVEEIDKKFKIALAKAKIDLPFLIVSSKREFSFPPQLPVDDQIVFSSGNGYKANLINMNWFILKRITPQVLFSIFLTTLTCLSFWFLYRNIQAQQRLAELKNDFISNMTHELKTPMTTVGVAIEALKNFNGIENRELTQEYLTIAQNELGRLSLLTDKILKTAIFESKGVDFQPESVDLEKIVEQVIGSMKLVLEKNKAVVSLEKTGSDFQFQGSQVHLTNVVYNLLDNALKYGRENPVIKIKLKESGNSIALSIQDNGIGISSEHQKKIFEKFFRVPTGDVHNNKGYGLGLSYVYSVVKAHKGAIEVESEVGKGSIFIISLPSKS